MSLLQEWLHFRGEFVLKSMLWDLLKWPEYRGGHISGVLIRGVPLYTYYTTQGCIKNNYDLVANSLFVDSSSSPFLVGHQV